MNRNLLIGIGAVILVILFIGLWFFGTYNSLIAKDQAVESQWGQVQVVLQRRFDLIPNLVETVKGFASQEQTIYDKITQARTKYAGNQTVENANEVESWLSRLLVIVESNPEIKSNTNFLALQDQLEGTENRISVERMRFNDEVRSFNTLVKQFPSNFVAGMFGFTTKDYFETVAGADVPPVVDFP
ncbi:MAG: LemA family protein [archaeon]|nr:LemA family protein [archaeon]